MTKMHPDFPKLFAEISADGANREARWRGIANFTKKYTKDKAEVLVRLAFETKPPAAGLHQPVLEQTLAAFHEALSKADASYEPASRQDQILAVGALMQFFENWSACAMAVTTTACGGARKANLPIDLVTVSENALSRLAASRRIRPSLANVKIELPEFEFEADLAEAQPNQPQTFKPVFDQVRDKLDETITALVGQVNSSLAKVVDANKMADEELDMLLWVFGGRSLSAGKAFADVPAAEQPLIFARELASRTKIYPGPVAIPALLSRSGIATNGKASVVEAVDAVSDEWIASVLDGLDPSPASSPIHLALVRRQETGAGGGWETGWAAVTGIDVATALSPIKLAELFYRENLWLHGS